MMVHYRSASARAAALVGLCLVLVLTACGGGGAAAPKPAGSAPQATSPAPSAASPQAASATTPSASPSPAAVASVGAVASVAASPAAAVASPVASPAASPAAAVSASPSPALAAASPAALPSSVAIASPSAVVSAPPYSGPSLTGQSLNVLYAGSLVNLMETGIGPAFAKASGASYAGQGAGSVALANGIKDQTQSGDVFVSADPTVNNSLMGANNGNWVTWYVVFARTSLVIGYNPSSQYAADFQRAQAGDIPWYQVLEEPGVKLGRTDPNLDPKGYHTLFVFDLAQSLYNMPDLGQRILGSDTNPAQIFPEQTLESQLASGALDAGFFYLNEVTEQKLPYITLPDQINQSQPSLAAHYAQATWTNGNGQVIKGSPILYTAAPLNQSQDPAGANAFVQYLVSSDGQTLMQQHGLLSSAVLYGGDRSQIPSTIQPLVTGQYQG